MSLTKIFFVLALTAVEETMACNPKKDDTCCSTPPARPQRSPAHRHDPALLCARAEDTGKCNTKMWYPERCASRS